MQRVRTIGDHVMMRLLRPSDAAQMHLLVQSNREHLRRWLPWLDQSKTEADSHAFLRNQWLLAQRREAATYGIFVDRMLAGVIGFHGFDRVNRITSLGYWLAREQCGRGIMRMCVAECLVIAFEEEDMNRMVIRCATENHASRRIPEALGFVHEGTQRQAEWLYDHFVDLEMYSLLRSEWRAASTASESGWLPM
jgi:ribosomal-protein-serine acetyltransferase